MHAAPLGFPSWAFLWPLFAIGMLLAMGAALDALWSARRVAPSSTA